MIIVLFSISLFIFKHDLLFMAAIHFFYIVLSSCQTVTCARTTPYLHPACETVAVAVQGGAGGLDWLKCPLSVFPQTNDTPDSSASILLSLTINRSFLFI